MVSGLAPAAAALQTEAQLGMIYRKNTTLLENEDKSISKQKNHSLEIFTLCKYSPNGYFPPAVSFQLAGNVRPIQLPHPNP